MSKTSAVDTKIHAVSPVSSLGSSSAGAGAASTGTAASVVFSVVVFAVSTTVTSSVGAVALSSAHATEPPKSALDKPSAISIFFIRIPRPDFLSY